MEVANPDLVNIVLSLVALYLGAVIVGMVLTVAVFLALYFWLRGQ